MYLFLSIMTSMGLIVFSLSVLLSASKVNSQGGSIGCSVAGKCIGTSLGADLEPYDEIQCLDSCKQSSGGCLYYTFHSDPSFKYCEQFTECNGLDTSCSDCVSGDVYCQLDTCFQAGGCTGTTTSQSPSPAFNYRECRINCLNDPDCNYFVYQEGGRISLCQHYISCKVNDLCPNCLYGSRNCALSQLDLSRVLVVGGKSSPDGPAVTNVDALEMDSTVDNCANVPSLPYAKAGMVSTFINKRAIFCGGDYTNKCYTFDGSTSEDQLAMVSPRYQAAGALVRGGNEWLVTGGLSNLNTFLDTTELYTKRNGIYQFESSFSMPEPLAGHCLVAVNSSFVYLIGGYNSEGDSSRVYVKNLESGATWSSVQDMSMARANPICAMIETQKFGREIVVLGGGAGEFQTEVLTVNTGIWRKPPGSDFRVPISSASALRIGSSMYVFGGYDGETTVYDSIFKLIVNENDGSFTWEEEEKVLDEPRYDQTVVLVYDEIVECDK